jgi:glycosyltransferase involved in cell wall biosynthesis
MSAALRVAYDATPLLGARTGVGVMTARVLRELARCDDIEVTAYATTWRGRGALPALVPAGVRSVTRVMPARPLHAAWESHRFPPIEWFVGAVDVVHGVNFVVPPARDAACIATVHDLTAIHHPEMCTAHTRRYPAFVRGALRRGAWIHTVSDFVRDEVIEAFDADPARVVTIPNGVDPIPDADGAIGQRAAGGERYVLALGTIEPRKDYPALVRAFDVVAESDRDLRLVIAGPDGWGSDQFAAAVASSHHRDRIVRLGHTDETGRAQLLRGATALAFASVYEGFGLPPLEAMSVGLPVLATGAGAVPEVVGDAALVVPVRDPAALADGLARIVSDDSLRADLQRRGVERAAQFRWDLTARGLVALYRHATVGS